MNHEIRCISCKSTSILFTCDKCKYWMPLFCSARANIHTILVPVKIERNKSQQHKNYYKKKLSLIYNMCSCLQYRFVAKVQHIFCAESFLLRFRIWITTFQHLSVNILCAYCVHVQVDLCHNKTMAIKKTRYR